MPIYEYACTKCGRITEAWQKFSEDPLCECDECGGKLKKLISQNSFHLKGSGWYVTDYAGKSSGNAKPSGQPDSSGKPEKPSGPTTSTGTKKAEE
ncbi:MAG TPA: zinc ribbon domain-containing protein [Desulfobacteraceae bacterium]|nr:zinc ribbon domain-containing protein [Desulfobacteraceae bacterium]